jgi:hypothetical protein
LNRHSQNSPKIYIPQSIDNPNCLLEQIIPPSPSLIIALIWSPDGTTLGALQQGSPLVLIWNLKTKILREIDVYVKDLVFIAFSLSVCGEHDDDNNKATNNNMKFDMSSILFRNYEIMKLWNHMEFLPPSSSHARQAKKGL